MQMMNDYSVIAFAGYLSHGLIASTDHRDQFNVTLIDHADKHHN